MSLWEGVVERLKDLSNTEKLLIGTVSLFHVAIWYLYRGSTPIPDEGTHSLVSLLYHDIAWNLGSFSSFGEIYQFGVDYLVYYPKLQVTYPPLYHIVNGLGSYSLFGVSLLSSKITTLGFSVVGFFLLFYLGKQVFDEKTALLGSFLFYTSSLVATYSGRALMDHAGYFALFLLLLTFFKFREKKGIKYLVGFGALSALAVLGNRPAVLAVPLLATILYLDGRGWRDIGIYLLSSLAFISPYLVLLWKIGGFHINYLVVQTGGALQGDPGITQLTGWTWYLGKLWIVLPVMFIPLGLFALHVKRKEENWKELLLWFVIFYIGLTIPQNKEIRLVMYALVPVLLATGYQLKKLYSKSRWIVPAFLAVFLLFSFPAVQTDAAFSHAQIEPPEGDVAVLSEDARHYSSNVMLRSAVKDKKEYQVFRPCLFQGKSGEEILMTLDEYGAEYVIVKRDSWFPQTEDEFSSVREGFTLVKRKGDTVLYRYRGEVTPPEKKCNYICLTGEKICEGERYVVE